MFIFSKFGRCMTISVLPDENLYDKSILFIYDPFLAKNLHVTPSTKTEASYDGQLEGHAVYKKVSLWPVRCLLAGYWGFVLVPLGTILESILLPSGSFWAPLWHVMGQLEACRGVLVVHNQSCVGHKGKFWDLKGTSLYPLVTSCGSFVGPLGVRVSFFVDTLWILLGNGLSGWEVVNISLSVNLNMSHK